MLIILFKILFIYNGFADNKTPLELEREAQQKHLKDTRKEFDESIASGNEVIIYAVRQEYIHEKDLFIGQGAVDIRFGDFRLRADRVRMDTESGDVLAEGNVLIDNGLDFLCGEKAIFNIYTRLGTVEEASGFLFPAYYFHGEKIEHLGEGKYRFDHGVFTSCSGMLPDWSFHISRALVHQDNYAYFEHLSLFVKKTPVFYTPYLVYPVKPRRSTGLLAPHFGHHSRMGDFAKNSFFWAITDQWDATFDLDYYTVAGVGYGLETRYVIDKDSKGEFYGYYIREKDTLERDEVVHEWGKANFQHQQRFKNWWDLKSSVKAEYISDQAYNKEFSENLQERTKQEIYSYANLTKNWSKHSLLATLDYREDLDPNTGLTVKKLPQLQYRMMRQPLYKNLVLLSLDLDTEHLVKDAYQYDKSFQKQDISRDLYRTKFFPQLFLSYSKSWFSLTPSAGLHLTYYDHFKEYNPEFYDTWFSYSDLPESAENENLNRISEIGNEGALRQMYTYGLEAVGPKLYKIYDLNGFLNLSRLKHLIEPRITYSFIPELNQDWLMHFDGSDRIYPKETVTFSLTNRFIGKRQGEAKSTKITQLGTITLNQSYDFYKEDKQKELEQTDQEVSRWDKPLSDTTLEILVEPLENYKFQGYLAQDPYLNKISRVNFDTETHAKNLVLGLNWSYIPNLYYPSFPDTNFLNYRVGLNLTPQLRVNLGSNYNVEKKYIVYSNASVYYFSQCWGFGLGGFYSEKEYVNSNYMRTLKNDYEFSFSIILRNIGSIGAGPEIPFYY